MLLLYASIIIMLGELIVELTALDQGVSGDIVFSIDDANFGGGIVVLANKTSINNLFYSVNLFVGPNVTQSTFDYDVSTTHNDYYKLL